MPDITIITGSLPERHDMLVEMLASVQAQTVPPAAHLIGIDWARRGVVPTYNQLGAQVTTEWMMCFADDDLLDPHHLETVSRYVDEHPDVDVVSTYCRSDGVGSYDGYNQPYTKERLEYRSIIAGWALVRTELWQEAAGFEDGWAHDWWFWRALSRAGKTFWTIPEVTVTYRFHGHNLSREGVG